MPKIAQKARYEIEPPIFEERLSKLPKVASVCRRRQDYASAVDVCATCRMAFASYYNRWGLTPHLADQRMTDRLEKGLTECFDVVGGVTDFADDQERNPSHPQPHPKPVEWISLPSRKKDGKQYGQVISRSFC